MIVYVIDKIIDNYFIVLFVHKSEIIMKWKIIKINYDEFFLNIPLLRNIIYKVLYIEDDY